MKMLGGNKLPDKLLVTTRQKNKINIAFENNMATDIKLPKTLLYKMIQSGDFLGALLSKIAGSLSNKAVPLAKKYFSIIKNNGSSISNRCSNSKKCTVLHQQH